MKRKTKRSEVDAYKSCVHSGYDRGYQRGKAGVAFDDDSITWRFYGLDAPQRWAERCGYADGRKAWLEQCQRIATEIANPSNPDEVEP